MNNGDVTISYYVEKYLPGLLAGIILISFSICKCNLLNNQNFIEVLRAAISVSAVLVGFMATMIAILISNLDTRTITYINESNHIGLLNSYFHSALLSGLVLAIGSTICIFCNSMEGLPALVISDIWVGVSSFFVFASFRVVIIMLSILKTISSENKVPRDTLEPDEHKAFSH